METKYISPTIKIDAERRKLLCDTPGDGCYGIYKAPAVYGERKSDDWQVYMETNGDPVMFPHADDADCGEALNRILSDADVSLTDFESALGCTWPQWCS